MTIELRPMTPAEFTRRTAVLQEAYASDLHVARGMSLDAARAESARQIATVLPRGVHSHHALLRTAVVGESEVGWIWATLPGAPGRPELAWIHNLEVDPGHRGNGYGRAIVAAIEAELAAHGVDRLGLNVFGHNAVAIGLYESMGFRVTAQQMAKSLRPVDPQR